MPAPTGVVATKMQPRLNGWAFPNLPSATFPDINFDTADLVSMFGGDADVCGRNRHVDVDLAAEKSTFSFSGGWSNSRITIADANSPGYGWIGDIAEVMIFSAAMSTADRHHTEKYLTCKRGLSQ